MSEASTMEVSSTAPSTAKSKKGGKNASSENVMAKLTLRHTFGSGVNTHDSILSYVSLVGEKDINDRVVFKVGRQACICDPDTGRQQYLTGRPKNTTNLFHAAISSNNRYLSLCESNRWDRSSTASGHAQASVYSLTTYSRQKTIYYASSGEFICSAFTSDAKYLATLCDGSEYQIVVWQWEKERIFKSVSLQSKPTKISVSPSHFQITVSGPQYLKCWALGSDGTLRASSLLSSSKESELFCDHKWLAPADNMHRMVAVSSLESLHSMTHDLHRKQPIYIFEGSEAPPGSSGPPIALEHRQTIHPRFETPNAAVDAIASYSKGFILLGREGHVSIYERYLEGDKRDPYFEVKSLSLDISNFISGAVLPSEDKLVLMSQEGRVLLAPIGNDLPGQSSKVREQIEAKDLSVGGYHEGAVLAASMAVHRSILATVSLDNTLRIWNFETLKCELVHRFRNDDPIDLGVHPNGFQVVVSFKEKIKLFNILLDKLKLYRETPAKSCKEVTFSEAGKYFAAASTINVLVFDTKTFTQLMLFQGHMMAVKRLKWGPGDRMLFSAGSDGNVYGWSMDTDQRMDIIASSNRSALIQDLAVDGLDFGLIGSSMERRLGRQLVPWGSKDPTVSGPESGASFVVGSYSLLVTGSDGSMRIAEWVPLDSNGKPREECGNTIIPLQLDHRVSITTIAVSICKKYLYAGTSEGSLRVYDWPIRVESPAFVESHAHSAAVVALRESPTGNVVVSASEDGSIFVHAMLKGQMATLAAADHSVDLFSGDGGSSTSAYNSGVVQMSREDMDEHIQENFDLRKKIEEMSTKYSFESHQRENQHADETKRLVERHQAAINAEKERFESMQTKMETKVRDLIQSLDTKELDHVKMTAELENRYEHKLADQLDRFDRLGEEMELLKQRCEGLLVAERQEFDRQLSEMKTEARQREKRMRMENKRVRDDRNSDDNAFKEILDQQEDEYEDELKQLIAAAESELKSERENITKLRTLVQTKNTKLDQLKKKLTELASSAKARQSMLLHEKKERMKLQDTIEHYKKNLLEREEALAEKEKTILELRSTTRTLENFRFVLDHRLQQLSAERGPITQHIEGLEQHIRTMYEELVEEFETKKEEAMKVEAKDLRISSYIHELQVLRSDNRQKEIYIATFRRELENVIGAFGKKELETAVKILYRKFVRGEVVREEAQKGHLGSDKKDHPAVKYLLNEDSDEEDDLPEAFTSRKTRSEGGRPAQGSGFNVLGKKKSSKKAIVQEIESELIENAKEANRQRQCMERTSENLEHRLRVMKTETERVNRTRLNENSHLIFECNDLRRELKGVQRKLDVANQTINELRRSNKALMNSAGTSPTREWRDLDLEGYGGDVSKLMDSHEELPSEASKSALNNTSGKPVEDSEVASHNSSMRDALVKSQSAVQLGQSGRDLSKKGKSKKVHLNSTPQMGTESSPSLRNMTLSSAQPRHGAPKPESFLQGSMTVEQRLLQKKEATIERLVDEATALTAQLDESNREKAMQRTELSRLRGLLANVIQSAPPLPGGTPGDGGRGSKRGGKASDRVLLTVGMNNATRVTSSNTQADFTGYPSQDDLYNMSAMGTNGRPNVASEIDDDSSIGGMKPVKPPAGSGFDIRKSRQKAQEGKKK